MIILPDMPFRLSTIPDDVLVRDYFGILRALQKLPQFLTSIIRQDGLNLKSMSSSGHDWAKSAGIFRQ